MPTYLFMDDATHEVVEQVFPAGSVPESIELDGKTYKRDMMGEIMSQHRAVRSESRYISKGRKYKSDRLGVLPSQIPEAMADAKSKGVKVEFDAEGTAMWDSRKERKEYCRAYGVHDRDGGYGDP